MNEKRTCKIVQDLLPNYIEKLTNEETNKFIEEHLQECTECQNVLANMKKDLNLEEEKQDQREIDYLKKFNKEKKKMKIWKKIVIGILIIVTIFIISIIPLIQKVIILSDLSEKFMKYEKMDNIYVKTTFSAQEGAKSEKYFKNGVEKSTGSSTEYWDKSVQFRYRDMTKTYIDYKDGSKALIINHNYINPDVQTYQQKLIFGYYFGDYTSLIGKFVTSTITSIKTGVVDGKECYILRNTQFEDPFTYYVEKDTGLTIQTLHTYQENGITKQNINRYEYSFGTVTDEDMKEPDASGYVVKDTGK